MANSDNVLRGGLTPKHVDVPELLRVLDFTPTTEAQLRPPTRREGIGLIYETPADEFAVALLTLDGDHLGHEVDASSQPRGPADPVVHRGSHDGARQVRVADAGTRHGRLGGGRRRPDPAGRARARQAVQGDRRVVTRSAGPLRPAGARRSHSRRLCAMVRPTIRGGGTM